MSASIPDSSPHRSSNFQLILDSFFASAGLPFSQILSAERIEKVFVKHDGLFGTHHIYSTAIMLWSFIGQVLRDEKEASCQAAVARVVTHCVAAGKPAPTSDTGDYCKARAKLSIPAMRELSCELAAGLEDSVDENWLWKNRHAKLVDGFTFTMPDTETNQKEFPQVKEQAPGVGFPIARVVAIVSLATACVMDLSMGPYAGKQTGENALLRSIFGAFNEGDIAVLDRCYCSFLMIALFMQQNTDVCARLHQNRKTDFRRGKRLGKHDHLVEWTKPRQRPEWMDEETFQQIPETITLREIRYNVVEKGKRTKVLTIVTTLIDEEHTQEEIAELYGLRWHVELDIRSIKDSLNLGHTRCKSPEMVRRELWATMLGYNLIRTTAAGAAKLHNKQPRQISFTTTCQYILSQWILITCGQLDSQTIRKLRETHLAQIVTREVANRPGRLEPRVLKRRKHGYPLMNKPRKVLKDNLRNNCS